ncbi:MAG: hypothetical protein JXQ65_08975 [Candidatus Marinimicrobia bacterium]|nr:hypothetical protein [Candidatus Neomarinimicrobiota bacterium]
MRFLKTLILPVFLATVWISLSEFVRNELLFKSYWVDHYKDLGIIFPSAPINGIVWGVWSLLFAMAIFFMMKKFSVLQTAFLAWLTGFIMMWVVIGNLNVLPLSLLVFAIPLSFLECILAAWIISKVKA